MREIKKTKIILIPIGVSIGSLAKDIAKTLNRMAPNNFRFKVKTHPNILSIPTPYEMDVLGKCEGDKIKEKCRECLDKFSICKFHSHVKLTVLHEIYHRYVGTEHCNNACIMRGEQTEKPPKRFCKDCTEKFRKALKELK